MTRWDLTFVCEICGLTEIVQIEEIPDEREAAQAGADELGWQIVFRDAMNRGGKLIRLAAKTYCPDHRNDPVNPPD